MLGQGIAQHAKTGFMQGFSQIIHLRGRAGNAMNKQNRFPVIAFKEKIKFSVIRIIHRAVIIP
jgi:hypothetical protein